MLRHQPQGPYLIGASTAVAVILGLELVALVFPRLDSPPPILAVPVVIAAYLGAMRGGLVCAALLVGYAFVVWKLLGHGDADAGETAVRLVALCAGLPLAAVLVGYLREKSDRRYLALQASEVRLREAHAKLEAALISRERILDQSMDVICTVNAAGEFVMVSAACERVWGYRPEELVGRKYLELVHPDDHARTVAIAERILSGEHTLNFINRYLCKDGSIRHTMWSSRWCDQDQLTYAVARDYTEQKQVDEERARFVAIIEATTDLVGMSWSDGRLSYINRAGREMLGLGPDEPLGELRIDQVFSDWAASLLTGQAADIAQDHGVWTGESSLQPRRGSPIPVSQTVLAHRIGDGRVEFMSTIARNITTIKALEARLREEAATDPLSGLLNRRHFMERFRTAVQSARRRGHPLSFAFCDLDNFKGINDRYGHAAGDQAIKAVAAILQQGVRCDDLVARYGGDEFCMMFAHSTAQQAAEAIERIRQAIVAHTIECGDDRFSITITVGVAELAPGEGDVESLMEAADRAMYFAKLAGRNQVQVADVDAAM